MTLVNSPLGAVQEVSVNTFCDSIASVSVPVTELSSLKSRLDELQAKVEAQARYIETYISDFEQ